MVSTENVSVEVAPDGFVFVRQSEVINELTLNTKYS